MSSGFGRILVAIALAAVVASHATPAAAWQVFMKRAECAETLRDWMSVAHQNPTGLGGSNQFELARHPKGAGAVTFPQTSAGFLAAHDAADELRLAGLAVSGETGHLAKYNNYCCKRWSVWQRRDATGTVSLFTNGTMVQPGGAEIVASQLCCEEAAARAKETTQCGRFVTARGVPLILTEDGPRVEGPTPVAIGGFTVPPLSSSPTPMTGRPIGCFRDPNSPFDLDGHLTRSATNTPQSCIALCREKGFAFAGVQYGQSCLCGNAYGRHGPANNCNMACTGDGKQTCGGFNANMVYSTGLAPPTNAQTSGTCPPNHLRVRDGRCIAVGRRPDP